MVPTEAEALLWFHLRDRRLAGYKFRRQRPVGKYFADFACIETMLVMELDGGQHVEASAHDETRTIVLQANGFRLLRFWNNEVLMQTHVVLERILSTLTTLTPALSPVREKGQEQNPLARPASVPDLKDQTP
jgi:adenine-specific DNA-methyltransferase